MYHNEKNKHVIAQVSNLAAEIAFLEKRIDAVVSDMNAGKGKSFHQEMLDEMKTELMEKKTEHATMSVGLYEIDVPEGYIASVKYDIQTLIGLLDAEVQNPQMLHQIVSKFVSDVFVQRENKNVYMTVQFANANEVLYEKNIVADM